MGSNPNIFSIANYEIRLSMKLEFQYLRHKYVICILDWFDLTFVTNDVLPISAEKGTWNCKRFGWPTLVGYFIT